MNEQAEQILTDMLQRVLDGVDTATEFAAGEVPDIIHQLLLWHMLSSVVWGALLFLFFGAWAGYLYRATRRIVDEGSTSAYQRFVPTLLLDSMGEVNEGWAIIYGMSSIPALIGLFGAIAETMNAIKIAVAPKLYLLEYGASLIK